MKGKILTLLLLPVLAGCNSLSSELPLKADGQELVSGSGETTSDVSSSSLPSILPSSSSSTSSTSPSSEETDQDEAETPSLPDIGGDVDIVTPPEEEPDEEDNHARYRIVFVNADGTILQEGSVTRNELPSYTGETPTLAPTDAYSFVFDHWTPEIVPATENTTYTAVYRQIKRFDVTIADDGNVLDVVKTDEGAIPEIDVSKMTRNPTKKYSYTYVGPEEELQPVEGDTSFEVEFSESLREYSVTFLDGEEKPETDDTPSCGQETDDTDEPSVLSTQNLLYGAFPEIPEAPQAEDGMAFAGFVDAATGEEVHMVDGDATYVPKFVPLDTVTISFDTPLGTEEDPVEELTFSVPEGEKFVLPYIDGQEFLYQEESQGQMFVPEEEITISRDMNLKAIDGSFVLPRYSYVIDEENKEACLTSVDFSECGDASYLSCPSVIYSPELSEFVPVTGLGDGENPVFRLNDPYSVSMAFFPTNLETIHANALTNVPLLTLLSLPSTIREIQSGSIQGSFNLNISFMKKDISDVQLDENWYIGVADVSYGRSILDVNVDGIDYALVDGDKAYAIGYSETLPGDVVVPEKIRFAMAEYEVVGLAGHAFAGASISSVVLPESVSTIGEGAFQNCYLLSSVKLPERLTSIPAHAFQNCYSLTGILLPDNIRSIGDYAFADSGLMGHGESTFIDGIPEYLRIFRLPAFLTSLGYRSFYHAPLGDVLVSKYVVDFGAEVFSDETQSTSITLYLEQEEGTIDIHPDWSAGVREKKYGIRETLPPVEDENNDGSR